MSKIRWERRADSVMLIDGDDVIGYTCKSADYPGEWFWVLFTDPSYPNYCPTEAAAVAGLTQAARKSVIPDFA